MDITFLSTIPREAHHFFINNNTPNKHQQMIINTNNNDISTTTNIIDNNNNMHVMMMSNHTATSTTSGLSSSDSAMASEESWAPRLLRECAKAISEKDSAKMHHLLWMLNELSSPYGDAHQKLASVFLQALFCRATASGPRRFRALTAVAQNARSFDSARRLILKFQEASPWTTFGHVASNGALLEALEGESTLHVIDVSNTLCTQWPTLLEALATRASDETPKLRLTVVDLSGGANTTMTITREVGNRMEKFARLMGVPFEFSVASSLNNDEVRVREGEALAVNCIGALRASRFPDSTVASLIALRPKIVTVVEEEANFSGEGGFTTRFEECLRFYELYFEMLEESFSVTSNEKLMLERECARGIVRVLACDDNNDNDDEWNCEKREKGKEWFERMKKGFKPVGYSDDVIDDVKALLKRYSTGWGLVLPDSDNSNSGIYLTWKEEPVVWASAWKP